MHDVTEAQFTDVHYRSLNGEGNFNWRMVFGLKYSLGEDMVIETFLTFFLVEIIKVFIITKMVITRKHAIEKFNTETKLPAVLNLQIWDNDSFSSDDFLGSASISLSHFPNPFSTAEKCSKTKCVHKHENLFAIDGSVRGWVPMYGKSEHNGPIKLTVS